MRALEDEVSFLPGVPFLTHPAVVIGSANLLQDTLASLKVRSTGNVYCGQGSSCGMV